MDAPCRHSDIALDTGGGLYLANEVGVSGGLSGGQCGSGNERESHAKDVDFQCFEGLGSVGSEGAGADAFGDNTEIGPP